MKRLILTLFVFAFYFSGVIIAQEDHHELQWQNDQSSYQSARFQNAGSILIQNKVVPVFFIHRLSQNDRNYSIQNVQASAISLNADFEQAIKTALEQPIRVYYSSERGKSYENVEIIPYRINPLNNQVERINSFDLIYSESPTATKQRLNKKADFASESVLANGDWYKFRIAKEGVYRLDAEILKELNIDLSQIELSSIQVFGNPGSMLPEPNSFDRTDDLKELAVSVFDENQNNRLDGKDHILFYAEGSTVWRYTSSIGRYRHAKNIYDDYNYVFLTHSRMNGKRISTRGSGEGMSSDTTMSGYRKLIYHEEDLVNFIASGREWYGESFKNQSQRTFKHTVSHARTNEKVFVYSLFGGRSVKAVSTYRLSFNGSQIHTATIGSVSGDYDALFMDAPKAFADHIAYSSNQLSLTYEFIPGTTNSDAWLNNYELHVPVDLNLSSGQHPIYLQEAQNHSSIRLNMSGDFRLWDVSDYHNTTEQLVFQNGGDKSAVFNSDNSVKHLISFVSGSTFVPEYVGKVAIQNLHGLVDIEYAIVTHSAFKAQADDLAEFHRNHYNYSVAVVELKQIYNEFSGGKADAVAIRDFFKMLYDRGRSGSVPFRFGLLFGDGSYDYKDRIDNNTNFIPTFQSREVRSPSYSYGSDDFFAILDDDEGYFDVADAREGLDIGIGRIPCRNTEQAQIIVNKIKRYHEPQSFGEWRIRQTYVADDEDNSIHFSDSEKVSGYIDAQNRTYNLQKVYMDAFEQQSFGSGEKYPDVNVAIDRSFDRGHVIFNYLGHGGPSGLAHERVVTRDQIRNWDNTNKLPVIITATCELTRYDDPSQDSPGELALFNRDGGAVALITTTRLVYINLNRDLNEQVQNRNLFDLSNGFPTLGEVFMKAKNNSQKNINQRNFSLIGDPAMQLAYPKLDVVTTSINDSIIGIHSIDTIKAFSKVKVTGEIRTKDGQLADFFNGVVYPTFFDKYLQYTTLGNDPASFVRTFNMQNSVLYRGLVSVSNGKFSFQFVVPKDIAYHYGSGKISYYANNQEIDASGYETGITIGGSESNIANDTVGPEIALFMDDETFIFGGMTGKEPLLLCKVFDVNGINTVGNGIGRDITAILDEGTPAEQILVLNDYYQATLDSYQAGEIRYPMEELPVGRHTLKIRVWDVYNNVSEDYTEFVVADDADLTLNHVLNYPNPFSTNTTFHFDHNREGQSMKVMIQIMTLSGKVIKTIHHTSPSVSSHFDQIDWNGRDEFGDRIARGVYIYKVTAKTEDGSKAEAVEKLVLLK